MSCGNGKWQRKFIHKTFPKGVNDNSYFELGASLRTAGNGGCLGDYLPSSLDEKVDSECNKCSVVTLLCSNGSFCNFLKNGFLTYLCTVENRRVI